MSQNKAAFYPAGHNEVVLRSHAWRTVANSAPYLQSSLKPHMKILDVGCGPGTITVDLATFVPQGHVTGIENVPKPLEAARVHAVERGVTNVDFVTGDAHALPFPDDTFDITHAHQVLQHVANPVQVLREMRRVTKPGGIVACRESIHSAFTWYPESQGITDAENLFAKVGRTAGAEPNAGSRIHVWAREAGFDPALITTTAGTWCFHTPEERAYWGESRAQRVLDPGYASSAIEGGFATQEDLERLSQAWKEWAANEDAWFAILHGEMLCRV